VQLVAGDRSDQNALVLRAGKDAFGEEIVPRAQPADVLVARRTIVEVQ
jgi:hypothetical protein